ncbi:P-loop containing nucleoside triphosphate hydrolase protein [Pilatotrama ljubarskyi]|nr:P-loop containing nucleoside triphosphate hydrolase protein [Pilatotrama ljubarskyi]
MSEQSQTNPVEQQSADLQSEPFLPPGQQVVLILVGLIGSGKSRFAQALEQYFPEFRRCSQDDLGDRRSVEALARRSLREGLSVCIDRTNFDESQRATWINIAREFPQAQPWVIVFDVPFEVCAARIAERTGHPTITSPELGMQVLQRFRSQYRPPSPHEGYTRVLYLKPSDCPDSGYSEADVRAILQRLRESPELGPPPFTSTQGGGFPRGSFQQRRSFQQRGFRGRGAPSYGNGSYLNTRGGYCGNNVYQSTLPWARQGEGSGSESPGPSYERDSAARRSGYQAGEGSSPGNDRTQDK